MVNSGFLNDLFARMSVGFTKRFRITLLIFLSILGIGFVTYTSFLKREGLPEIAFPVVFVQSQYEAGNVAEMDQKVTLPIEQALKNVDGIKQVDSNTSPVSSSLVVSFQSDYTPEEGAEAINKAFESELDLPKGASINVLPFKPTFDGTHEFLIAVSGGTDVEDLQEKAEQIATDLETQEGIKEANVFTQINDVFDPQTQSERTMQTTFARAGEKENGEMKFSSAVLIGIMKDKNSSDKEVSEDIKSSVESLKNDKQLDGYDVHYTLDVAEDVEEQIDSLEGNAVTAMIVVLVVLLVLVNWRSAIVTAIFIPTVLAATFIILQMIGYTLNIIVLFALILVLGLFVDDGTIVVEAIDYQKRHGENGLKAIYKAVRAISIADTSGTVTTMIAFAPLFFITGILGEFISPIPVTVNIALAVSLVIALTILPMLSHWLIRDKKDKKRKNKYIKAIDSLVNKFNGLVIEAGIYVSRFVRFYLSKWYLALLMIVVSLILIFNGLFFSSKLKFSVFPPQKDSNTIYVTINYPNGLAIDEKEDIAKEMEKLAMGNYPDEITGIEYFSVGRTLFGFDQAFIGLDLTDMKTRETSSVEIAEKLTKKFEGIEGASVIAKEEQVGAPAEEYSFKMQIFDEDQDVLSASAAVFKEYIEKIELKEGIKIEDVKVEYIDALAKTDGKRYAQVAAKLSDPTNTGAVLEVENSVKAEFGSEKVRSMGLQDDALGFYKGSESDNIDAFNSTLVALLVAIVIMYALLVLQFNSFIEPLLVFVAFPFSFAGLFPGLYLTDNALSFFVMVGVIALVGIVVNNTIMLMDYIKQNEHEGKGVRDSIADAIKVRFRPLVTTSTVAIAGLLPLALTDPLWESLALSIVFGLAASTTMVILIFPAYFAAVTQIVRIVNRGVGKVKEAFGVKTEV